MVRSSPTNSKAHHPQRGCFRIKEGALEGSNDLSGPTHHPIGLLIVNLSQGIALSTGKITGISPTC